MRSQRKILNKKGSMTIYVLLFATSLISLVTLFIGAAKSELVKSGAYELGNLWADSVLAEYDIPLYQEYGLFGYYGNEALVEDKLKFYCDYTFGDKGYARCNVEDVNIYDYSLAKPDNILEQIRIAAGEELVSELVAAKDKTPIRYDDGSGKSGTPRVISNQSTLRSLPSYGRTDTGLLDRAQELIKSFTSIKDIVKKGTDEYLINQYIQKKFRNTYYLAEDHKGYFFSEQEYIISGKASDEQNRKSIRNRIIAMREVMNGLYIESNYEMKEKILAAATVLSAGYAPEEVALVIAGAWALAESVNDYELLIRGKPVPVLKTEESWAVSLDNVINNKESGCIDTGNTEGDDYNDYIVYLLCLLDDNTKLLRIMDLIQINMRYNYRSDFLLSEHYSGLEYSLKANGELYEFKEKY